MTETEATGKIFNIQSFSTSDGPGIRTVVFFQGCNLHCKWCHNPESQPLDAPEAFLSEKCIGCGGCHAAEQSGAIYECFAGARTKKGRIFTPGELWKLLETDMPYLKNSEGGITFSGGECMLQLKFLTEIVRMCRENGIHTAVDTAGHVPYDSFAKAGPDMFLYDIKASSRKKHMELCGVDGVLIWENLRKLLQDKYKTQVRVPCVPGANWDELPDIASRLQALDGAFEIELIPYHRLGEGKAAWFGKEAQIYDSPKEEEMNKIWNLFNCHKKYPQG